MTRVVHCKKEKYDVYIGRPSKWGNPYSHKEGTSAKYKVETREEAIQKYREYILSRPDLLECLYELKGCVLGCWCACAGGVTQHDVPFICHGQVLLQLLEDYSI